MRAAAWARVAAAAGAPPPGERSGKKRTGYMQNDKRREGAGKRALDRAQRVREVSHLIPYSFWTVTR
jgi:hypothetical protein